MRSDVLAGACALALVLAAGNATAEGAGPLDPYVGQPLTTITYELPAPTLLTPANAVTGLFGGIAAAITGDELKKNDAFPNPADEIMTRLSPLVTTALKPPSATAITEKDSDDNGVDDMAAAAPGRQGVVVAVESRLFMVIYFPFDWTHYKLKYEARARLVDAASGKKIRQSSCDYDSDDFDGDNPPRLGEMLHDKGAMMKMRLSEAAGICAVKFQQDFALPPAEPEQQTAGAVSIAAAPVPPVPVSPAPDSLAPATGNPSPDGAPETATPPPAP